jgi:hypothetical protein
LRNHVLGLALAVGGGVDLDINRHLALRLLQADCVLTRLKDDTETTVFYSPWPFTSRWQVSPRLGFGLTLKAP